MSAREESALYAQRLTSALLLCTTLLGCAGHERVNIGTPDRGSTPSAAGVTGAASVADAGRLDTSVHPVMSGAGTTAAMTKPAAAGSTQASGGSGASTMTPPEPVLIDRTETDRPAGLTAADVKKLIAGGPLGTMKWLYPYDGTVFPRGTLTPLVMWHSDSVPDAVYLRMKSQTFEYKGVLQPSTEAGLFRPSGGAPLLTMATRPISQAGEVQTQLAIPQDIWERAGQQTLGKADPFTLELTEYVNGEIHGPIVSRITIAQANFKGSIYYNTCVSAVNGTTMSSDTAGMIWNGRLLRIPPGGKAELVLPVNKCHGCHSVSADGSRLISQEHATWDTVGARVLDPNAWQGRGASYQLGPDSKPISTTGNSIGGNASYGALYPDGSKYLSAAIPSVSSFASDVFAIWGVGLVRRFDPVPDNVAAALYDTTSGQVVPGTGIPSGAMMPMFSPDGTRLVFNDFAINTARGLAVMDYDSRNHKAGNYSPLAQEAATSDLRPGWPFFLPDNKAVVFVRAKASTFTSETSGAAAAGAGNMGLAVGQSPSDLYIADVAAGSVTLLAKAMGYNTPADAVSGTTYFVFGDQDTHHNYYPTVSPVAAGGYFWVFFDSIRNFGSLGVQRALWGFAIDIRPNGSYTTDPSHPAFYLPGQEFGTSSDNHRAFSALDRCKPDGAACATGIDCCGGRCGAGTCSQPPPPEQKTCANRDEHCASAADCCDGNNYCINGFCAWVELL